MNYSLLPLLLMLAASTTYASSSTDRSDQHDGIGKSIQCTFENCTAQINGSTELAVSCDGKSVYSGAYELNTDFRTIEIQAKSDGGPKITTQTFPSAGAPTAATLLISGRSISGTCNN